MATNVTQGWLRVYELQAEINRELGAIMPRTTNRETPWSITNKQLLALLANAPKRFRKLPLLTIHEVYSPELVHPLTLITAAKLSGAPLNYSERQALLAETYYPHPSPR